MTIAEQVREYLKGKAVPLESDMLKYGGIMVEWNKFDSFGTKYVVWKFPDESQIVVDARYKITVR